MAEQYSVSPETLTPPRPREDVDVIGMRVLATIIDAVVLTVALLLVSVSFGIVAALVPDETGVVALFINLALFVVSFALFFGYYVIFEGRWGQTPGKAICGIKVIREDGGIPGTKAALVRTLLRVVDGFFSYLVGFVIAISSEKRQRLGDMAAHTLVVHKR